MKTSYIVLVIIVAAAAGFGLGRYTFNGQTAKNGYSSVVDKPADTINTFDFEHRDSAVKWVDNLKEKWAQITGKDAALSKSMPEYFTIKSQDVLSAMGVDTAWKYVTKLRYMRVTLGFDKRNNTVKAFIQPVVNVDFKKTDNPAGTALFFNKHGQIVNAKGEIIDSLKAPWSASPMKIAKQRIKGSEDSVYVADLSTPCPNTCGN